VATLREIGIDISGHRSKAIREIPFDRIDLVVTLCAEEAWPVFPRAITRLHWGLEDPASAPGDEALSRFREVRDELRRRIERLLGS
jgi:arsenate reductase (thioredoxin)